MMDNETAYRLIDSNKRLIEALGMHWENESRKQKGESPAYRDVDFNNLAFKPYI
jgi:hypothetical protein